MMTAKWNRFVWGGAVSVLLLTGCETPQGLVAKRIRQEGAFFASLPEDAQERLTQARLEVGDPMTAAWIVYGEPTRRYERNTETGTTQVWSYCKLDSQPVDQFTPVYYPVAGRRGMTQWQADFQLQRSYLYDRNEYLRIEFKDGTVIAIETQTPQP